MGQGISELLTFAIGVAISPVPIIAVILMLFSQRARVNGPVFLLGVLLLLLAVRNWRNRPTPGSEPETPRWMAGLDDVATGRALVLGLLLAGVNPKNLILTLGAAAGLGQLGVSTTNAALSLIVFVVVGSLTIAGPVVYYLLGGKRAEAELKNSRPGSGSTTPL